MTQVHEAVRTCGLSPKVLYPAIVGLLTAVLLKFGVSLDSTLEQFLNVVAMILTGYLVPPGDVVIGTPEAPDTPGEVDPFAGDVRPPE